MVSELQETQFELGDCRMENAALKRQIEERYAEPLTSMALWQCVTTLEEAGSGEQARLKALKLVIEAIESKPGERSVDWINHDELGIETGVEAAANV